MKASIFVAATLIGAVFGHGDPKSHQTNLKEKVPEGMTWQQWHMKEEHDIDSADPESFFKIHDFRKASSLNREDILRIYGLLRDEVIGDGDGMGSHDESEGISPELKDQVVSKILYLMDSDKDGEVSLEEFLKYSKNGENEFPDVGVGIGHHLNFEEEYEQHHWNKFHAKDDPEVKNVHAEDIEHELLHHEHEIEHGNEAADVATTDKDGINQILLENVPYKYKRSG